MRKSPVNYAGLSIFHSFNYFTTDTEVLQELNLFIPSHNSAQTNPAPTNTPLTEHAGIANDVHAPYTEIDDATAPILPGFASPNHIQLDASTIPDSIERELSVPPPKRRKKQFQSTEVTQKAQQPSTPPSPVPQPSFDEPRPASTIGPPIAEAIVFQPKTVHPLQAISSNPAKLLVNADSRGHHEATSTVTSSPTTEILKITAAAPAPGSKAGSFILFLFNSSNRNRSWRSGKAFSILQPWYPGSEIHYRYEKHPFYTQVL